MRRRIALPKFLAVLALLAFPTLTKACPAASDLAAVGAQPDAAAMADCLELARFDIRTGRGTVQGSIYGAPETDLARVRAAEEALTRSGRVLSGLGSLGVYPVDLYMSPSVYSFGGTPDEDTLAAAQPAARPAADSPRKCIMAAFPSVGLDAMAFTISHEFFHCMQFREFGRSRASTGAEWWVEGSAEWFASLVYQGTGFSDGWVAGFDETSATTPITRMEYPSVVFFWWLHQNYGSGQIVGLLSVMPDGGSQEDALAGVVSDDEFLRFVTDYLEGNIRQPGGRAAASTPLHEDIRDIDADEDIDLEARRFVAHRTLLRFACGTWTTRILETQGGYKALRLPDGDWDDLPGEFSSDSEARIEFLIAGGATGEDGFNLSFEARKTPCAVCRAVNFTEDSPEACLIGEWRLASGGLGAKIGEMLNDSSGLSEVDYPDLDGLLILRRDGTFTLKADDEGSMQTSNSKGIFSAQISLSMEKEGTWSINGDDLVQCYRPVKSINIDETITDPDGKEERFIGNQFLGPKLSYTETRQFICTEGVLEITQRALLAPTINWVYRK